MAVLHRASWLVPVHSPPMKDGGVIIEQGRIVEVGSLASLSHSYVETIHHGQGILMPGLINGHCHLELSHFKVEGRYAKAGDMVGWIEELLASRQGESEIDVASPCYARLCEMADDGVDVLVDVGNDPSFTRAHKDLEVLFFHELLGLSDKAGTLMAHTLTDGGDDYTCHGPYSTNKNLMLRVKRHCVEAGTLFSIHVAESLAEKEFIYSGHGDFKDFLQRLGSWDGSFMGQAKSPVAYLDDLGLLDTQTLCVHCVHIDAQDISRLVRAHAKVCLCLGSNEYIGVGIPPVADLLDAGLKPCLGTDSSASNPQLSIWHEMNLVHHYYPEIASETILNMATANGAAALGRPNLGTLAAGGTTMIFVDYDGDHPCDYLSFDPTPKQVRRCL